VKIQIANTTSLLLERAGTLMLSIVLAMIVWLVAVIQQNPFTTNEFREPIPITVRGLAENLQTVQDLSRETTKIILKAPAKTWSDLRSDDFTAYIDLDGYAAGEHEVQVHVNIKNPQAEFVELQQPSLRIQLDEVITKTLGIIVETTGETAEGYATQEPLKDPALVNLRGPSILIDQVASAKVEIPLRNANSQIKVRPKIALHNAEGHALSRIAIEPEVVEVTIPIVPLPGHREVAIRVKLQGEPAPGYRLSSVRSNPVTTVLWGNKDELDRVPGFVETAPLVLDDMTQDIEKRLELQLPEGVNALNGSIVMVTANVTPIEGGRTIQIKPIFDGLESGLTAEIELEAVEIILSGPVSLLESLDSDDIFVILELADLVPNSHVIEPRLIAPDGITVEGLLPETVEVLIKELPTPTPDPEPTPPVKMPILITPVLSENNTIDEQGDGITEPVSPVTPTPVETPASV